MHGRLGEAEVPVLQRIGKGRIGIRLAEPFYLSLYFGRFLIMSSVTKSCKIKKNLLKEIIRDVA